MPVFQHLRAFKHSFVVNSPIDRVWEFYTDIKHLEIITPKQMKLKIIMSQVKNLPKDQKFGLRLN